MQHLINDEDHNVFNTIPAKARALTSIGDETLRAVHEFFTASQGALFPTEENPSFQELSEAFIRKNWIDVEVAKVVRKYKEFRDSGNDIEVKSIVRWILAHDDGSVATPIIECMDVRPPEEIEIIKVLSKKGSQKIVFLATWRLQQQEVVLKKVIGPADSIQRVLYRELQPHPLSMVHPNIIETHSLKNDLGESFLVEKKLPSVLYDKWRATGIQEAAKVLFDIAQAIKFLHDHGLVHGDIKPDNIGRRIDNFVLLDFGICRPTKEFSRESTPTGSMRTRAPELFGSDTYLDPEKVDIWALGATIFNALCGRFPLIQVNEEIPRVSNPKERKSLELMIAQRVKNEWNKWVDFGEVPNPLSGILSRMLEKDVNSRINAKELVELAEEELSAFIPLANSTYRFSPLEELEQIEEFLADKKILTLFPFYRKQQIVTRLTQMKSLHGFDESKHKKISELISCLS